MTIPNGTYCGPSSHPGDFGEIGLRAGGLRVDKKRDAPGVRDLVGVWSPGRQQGRGPVIRTHLRAATTVALVVVSTAVGAGCDQAPQQRTRVVAELSAEELNEAAASLIDCSVPGLGVESPLAPLRTDITGDGTPEVIASFECVTGDSSSFSHVVAYDGGSAADVPRVISTLVRMPETATGYEEAIRTGAKVRRITAKGSVITVVASKWRYEDAKACPTLKYVQLFTVRHKALMAQEPTELNVAGCGG
ncbi:hypothetical protein OHO28_25355 [Streptomyces europaeiscabiei]|uniref:hypothetical protein n=1 Tax=Streptomyces europaeiscabiei TaxID=146819 RepID=UPI002E18FCAF